MKSGEKYQVKEYLNAFNGMNFKCYFAFLTDLPITCDKDNGGCNQICRIFGPYARCDCRHGYYLLPDMRKCQDINECKFEGTCSQKCKNVPGSYRCSCVPGYQLKPDGRGCKALGRFFVLASYAWLST